MDHRQHATEPEQSSAQEGSAARGLPALTDFDALACALVNNVLVRAVSGFYERMAAREVVRRPRAGAVSFVQRFESALRLKLHLHVLWLNAVGGSVWPNTARCDANGRYRCEWLAPTARWHPCDAQGRPRMQRPGRPIRRQHLSPGAYRVLVWGEHVLPAFSDAIVAIDQVAAEATGDAPADAPAATASAGLDLDALLDRALAATAA